ncbi:MAG: ATP-binding protein [Gammaproteobacteria bacterium]|nr:ATP-binding protein [Gammaproteobacteria bacterium]
MKKNDQTIIRLQLSYFLLIGLILFMAIFGFYNTRIINENLKTITTTIQSKINIVSVLKESARERTLRLNQMVLLDDPFDIDSQWMKFNHHGAIFAQKRLELLSLNLSLQEKLLLDNQAVLTKKIIPVQLDIANLAIDSNKTVASLKLINVAAPLQEKIFSTLDELFDLYQLELTLNKQNANNAYNHIKSTSLFVGIIAVMLGILSAIWVTKRIRNYQKDVTSLNNNLENLVKERTEKLTQTEQSQRNLIENSLEGIITIDQDNRILSYNSAAESIFQFSSEDAIESDVNNLIKFTASKENIIFSKLVGTELEGTGITKTGYEIPLYVGVSEFSYNGRLLYSLFVRDITEQKQIEKLKNEFISTVSHELRTPITSIRGSLGLILGGVLGELPDKVINLLNLANNNANRLLFLINDLLDVQKIESGKIDFQFKSIDLVSLLKDAVGDNRGYADEYNVKLKIDTGLNSAVTSGDETKLQQVMANLLSNAIKYSPSGETVTVVLTSQNDKYCICVNDNGAGMADEFQSKIFEKFTQEDSSTTRSKGGTGLGLSIAKLIIEHHDSDLNFTSKLNEGTSFFFCLKKVSEQKYMK